MGKDTRIEIKPGGFNIDEDLYEIIEIHRNVTVEVLRNKRTGECDVGWYRQEDTEDIDVNSVEKW